MIAPEPQNVSVVVERSFAHPPDRLWRALTQPHLVAEWLMKGDIAPSVGHRFTLTGEWGGVLDCEVLEAEPGRRLVCTWNLAHADPRFALESVVTFTLTPTETGTHLKVEQVGFRPEQKAAHGGARVGWPRFLAKLEALLDRIGSPSTNARTHGDHQ